MKTAEQWAKDINRLKHGALAGAYPTNELSAIIQQAINEAAADMRERCANSIKPTRSSPKAIREILEMESAAIMDLPLQKPKTENQ